MSVVNTINTPKIKVFCVDDSVLVRSLMTEIVNSQPDMQVCATTPDPLVARELIKLHNPDVLTLDVEMPRMDGLDFLENAADAGRDGVVADRARQRNHAARAGTRRGRFRDQAEGRHSRRHA